MSYSMVENFAHLLDLIEQQSRVINKQNDVISRLINETLEKENYINELVNDQM